MYCSLSTLFGIGRFYILPVISGSYVDTLALFCTLPLKQLILVEDGTNIN